VLADTIQNGINGFSFEGKDELEQANNLVATLAEMLQIFQGRLPHWRKLCRNAAATRFSWDQTVAGYLQHLYGVKSR
jgi:starch synthase